MKPKGYCILCKEKQLIKLDPPAKGHYCIECGVAYTLSTGEKQDEEIVRVSNFSDPQLEEEEPDFEVLLKPPYEDQ